MVLGVLMAPEATGTHRLGRRVLKGEHLALIASALNVFFAGPVTRFTAVPFRPFVPLQLPFDCGDKVRGRFKMAVDFLVAGLAHFGTHIERRIAREYGFLCRRFAFVWRSFVT